MKRKNFGKHFLAGVLLAANMVVADDVKPANGQHAGADLVRRALLSTSPPASATEAVSATTVAAKMPVVEWMVGRKVMVS